MTKRIDKLIGPAIAEKKRVQPVPSVPPEEYARHAAELLALGYDERTPANFKPIVNCRWALETGNARKGLCLFGAVGRGKTLALEALDLAPIEAKVWVRLYEAARESLREIAWRDRAMTIDDLGHEETYVHFGTRLEVLDEIITIRHTMWQRHGTLTHITGNLTAEAYDYRYGERLLSRIKGMCNVVIFKGPDRRNTGNEGWL